MNKTKIKTRPALAAMNRQPLSHDLASLLELAKSEGTNDALIAAFELGQDAGMNHTNDPFRDQLQPMRNFQDATYAGVDDVSREQAKDALTTFSIMRELIERTSEEDLELLKIAAGYGRNNR